MNIVVFFKTIFCFYLVKYRKSIVFGVGGINFFAYKGKKRSLKPVIYIDFLEEFVCLYTLSTGLRICLFYPPSHPTPKKGVS